MARIRSIHPDACDSDKLGEVSSDAERLYWRLQTHCDDEGRCEDAARLIWARCVPMVRGWDADRVEILLEELHRHGLITRYESGGKRYLAVIAWDNYQHPKRATPSKCPEPPSPAPIPLVENDSPTPPPHVEPGGGVEVEKEGRGEGASPAKPATAFARSTFDVFWERYPRKVGKGDALKAWRKALHRASDELIVEGLDRMLPGWNQTDKQFIPHPATWLNRDGWLDEPPQPRRSDGERRTERGHDAIARVVNAAAASGLTTPELES